MADDGLRVLAVARGEFGGGDWPSDLTAIQFTLLGLTGLADPVRPTVAAALAECYTAGMRVIMITGDYPGTARAIARQIGLAGHEEVVTGAELDSFDDATLRTKVGSVNIFARVVPEQKLRLVKVLKENGEVVAMTGDGVNDAPALKAADIGIAMGGRGTDVARESASLVLLDDDFASIVHTARLGRRIYENIRNAMCYLLAVHVPIAGMSLLPLVFGWPLVFLPAHIVFLEFVINPACSIVFEAEEVDSDVMRRPPRVPGEALLGGWMLGSSLLQGFTVLIAVAIVFGTTYVAGEGEALARAMAFTTIVLGNLGLILANRSRSLLIVHTVRRFNRALWWILGGTLAGVAFVLYEPHLRDLFRFAPMSFADILICILAALLSLAWFEVYKWIKWRPSTLQLKT
jgi:Ca2+-transporting ATPase